jgi:hypothetical protein
VHTTTEYLFFFSVKETETWNSVIDGNQLEWNVGEYRDRLPFGNDEYFMSKLGPQDFDGCFRDDEYFRDKTSIQKELESKQKGRLDRRSNTGGVIV